MEMLKIGVCVCVGVCVCARARVCVIKYVMDRLMKLSELADGVNKYIYIPYIYIYILSKR